MVEAFSYLLFCATAMSLHYQVGMGVSFLLSAISSTSTIIAFMSQAPAPCVNVHLKLLSSRSCACIHVCTSHCFITSSGGDS